jgi:uncharacterized protein YdhG (YjbR/CyaY superfamily)
VDEYIQAFPEAVQSKLQELRPVVRETAPQAGEEISYGIPTFHLNGNLVHFAAYANHIGFYSRPSYHDTRPPRDPFNSHRTNLSHAIS